MLLCVRESSDIEDEELAALCEDSTTDFDRSRCFWRNLGSLGPCGVEGGEEADGECFDGLFELDIVVERGVVAVVIVVASQDWDAPDRAATQTRTTTFTTSLHSCCRSALHISALFKRGQMPSYTRLRLPALLVAGTARRRTTQSPTYICIYRTKFPNTT